MKQILTGILVPLFGTGLGSAAVFVLRERMRKDMERILIGFASGVMIAASIWSLIIPAMEQEKLAGLPGPVLTVIGYWLGIFFLLFLDRSIPHLHLHADQSEGPASSLTKTWKMLLAVTIHNIPEGMAVGVVFASLVQGGAAITVSGALALSIGIALQNIPEGAIISMPLYEEGMTKGKAFLYGLLSGAVEPAAAAVTILLASFLEPWMPLFLSFAAGAMMYVVVEELIPEMSEGEHSNIGTIAFGVGFTGMMVLDILL